MMNFPCPPRAEAARRARGVALIVVLAFVVLLTGLMVAFFTRAITNRQLSNSSSGQTRVALLARSAADTVISGFKSEIAAGSAPIAYSGAGSRTYTVYMPTVPPTGKPSGTYAVPVRYPKYTSATSSDAIPNLVRESRSGDAGGVLPFPAGPSNASAVNSSSDSAVGGRNVTPARWNSHYLMPRFSAPANAPSTPDVFTAPDWVLVNRVGPTIVKDISSNFASTSTNAVNNSATANQNYVIGRYAYAVYDEGGLLDMNVAGHPAPGIPAAATGFTATQVGQKGSLALADLTQLPVVSNPIPGSSTGYLTQMSVDQIIGWRNYASAGLSPSSYPNFSFTSAQAASWFKNFTGTSAKGFLSVYNGVTATHSDPTGPTDQAFLSRQQLLKLQSSLGFSANVLQYMGTFSRGLEQPSYVPDPGRPTIVNTDLDPAPYTPYAPSVTPPSPLNNDSYIGNNDAVGADAAGNANPINTAFLNIRVKTAFPRADVNKTMAIVGEPLVKRKFPLTRLGEVTYNAADNTPSATDSNLTNGNHIKSWFGLSRASTSQPWTYNHGGNHILTLTEVSKLNPGREPDFAELLKAAINTGSLGKGGPNLHNNWGCYQYGVDVSVDFQIIEIMANLIDQYDTDSYPTVIQITIQTPAGAIQRTARGVEDLPYFYRYHTMGVVTRPPSPHALGTDNVTFYNYVNDPSVNYRGALVKTIGHCKPNVAVSDPGEGAMLFVPDVWNPHDATAANATLPGPRPQLFRITAVTDDPLGQAPWPTWTKAETDNDYYSDIPDLTSPDYLQVNHKPMTEATAAMTFSDSNGRLFREPTLLWRADAPSGINLQPDGANSLSGPYTDFNTTSQTTPVAYYGLCPGKTGLAFSQQISSKYIAADPANPSKNLPQNTYFFFESPHLWYGVDSTAMSNSYEQITFRLEYQDPNGSSSWFTYDEKYPDFHQVGHPQIAGNINDVNGNGTPRFPNSRWADPLPTRGQQMNSFCNVMDPRTARFGTGTSSTTQGNFLLEYIPKLLYSLSESDSTNKQIGQSKFTVVGTQRQGVDNAQAFGGLGQYVNFSNPGMTSDPGRNIQMRWFSGTGYSTTNSAGAVSPREYDALFAQNNPALTISAQSGGDSEALYYEDADGICRRAMAAYADTTVNGTANAAGLPLTTSTTFSSNGSIGMPNSQTLSRPMILNRPFRSVGEMSYAFRGTPWKNIDFFTPESGDAALLDVFCVNDLPADGVVAGKVNLNTHQAPVLQAMLAGTTRDEDKNLSNLAASLTYPMAAIDSVEASAAANKLVSITTDAANAWHGPLANTAHLVGRYIPKPGDTSAFALNPDFYTFKETASNTSYTYAGFCAALSQVNANSSVANASVLTPRIQRFRESAIRALADSGQTRVWNLLIDVVAQTGRYAPNAAKLSQFSVDGEQRCWVHVAIDRLTGQIIDKQVEVVTE